MGLLFNNGTSTAVHSGGNTNVLSNLPILSKGKFYFEFTPANTAYAFVILRHIGEKSNHNSDLSLARMSNGYYTQCFNNTVRYILEARKNNSNKSLTDFTLYHSYTANDADFTTISPPSGQSTPFLQGVNADDYRIGVGVGDSSSPAGLNFYFNFGSDQFKFSIPDGCNPINSGLFNTNYLYLKNNAAYGMKEVL